MVTTVTRREAQYTSLQDYIDAATKSAEPFKVAAGLACFADYCEQRKGYYRQFMIYQPSFDFRKMREVSRAQVSRFEPYVSNEFDEMLVGLTWWRRWFKNRQREVWVKDRIETLKALAAEDIRDGEDWWTM